MGLLAVANLIDVDFNLKEDRSLFDEAQKCEFSCFLQPRSHQLTLNKSVFGLIVFQVVSLGLGIIKLLSKCSFVPREGI
jgi:hypothetical protein